MNEYLKADQSKFTNGLKLLEPKLNLSLIKSPSTSDFTLSTNSLRNDAISRDSGVNSISSDVTGASRETLLEMRQVCIGDSLLTIEKIANECRLNKKNENETLNETSIISNGNPSFQINLRKRIIFFIVIYIGFVFILLFIYMAGYFGSKYL